MRSGLILLLLAVLALLWWVVIGPPAAESLASPETPSASLQKSQQESAGEMEAVATTPGLETSAFTRGNLAEIPVELRAGFFAVQLWRNQLPLSNTEVSVLPFAQLGEVMMEGDLWPFIITPDVVLQYGQARTTNSQGVVQIPISECPTYVAARSGIHSAMLTLLPELNHEVVLRLQLENGTLWQVQVRYANGGAVINVPVTLKVADGNHETLLLGEERRRRTSAQGLAVFSLAPRARRLLGEAQAMQQETAALAAALGYAESDFDSLMGTPLRAEVAVYAGERVSQALPLPWSPQVPVELVLEHAAPLLVRVHKADGTGVESKVRIEGVTAGRRGGKPYVFAAPHGEGRLAAVAVKGRYQLEILMQGIDGTMERVVDGPQVSGEPLVVDFVIDDWPRVTALLQEEDGQAFANCPIVLGMEVRGRLKEISVYTDAQGRFEAFVPARLHNTKIDKVWLSYRYGQRGSMKVKSAVLPIQGMFSSFEDLGTLTLK